MAQVPIRLLLFCRESFPTSRVDVDVLFGRQLAGRGHKVDFVMQAADASIHTGRQTWHGRTVWVGRTDTTAGFVHRLRKRLLGFAHDVASLKLLRKSDYDAVLVRDKFLFAALALLVARWRRLQFLYWLSWPEPESLLARARAGSARYPLGALVSGRVFAFLLYRWILPHCDHAFVQSQQMKADICTHGIPAEKLTPVPMGVERSDVVAVPKQACGAQGFIIGYLGIITAERRLCVLVEMIARLRHDGTNARLLIVGDAENAKERQRIEALATELGVSEAIRITGFMPRSDALTRIATADICISPFFPTPILQSTSPTKLVEYLAIGKPVIANDHPEQRLVLRETRAGLCVPWGAQHFARAAQWLMHRSAAEREAMGERGRNWVLQNRTYDRIADLVEQAYERVPRRPV